MLQKEFEERIGRKVTEKEYVEANAMYMLAGDDMDKDTFCREWKKVGGSPLVKGLFETAYHQGKVIEGKSIIIKDLQIEKEDTVNFLLRKSYALDDEVMLNMAIAMVGHAAVIRKKLELDLPLWDVDKLYINQHIE